VRRSRMQFVGHVAQHGLQRLALSRRVVGHPGNVQGFGLVVMLQQEVVVIQNAAELVGQTNRIGKIGQANAVP
jgi:hypothetical protein